MSSAVLIIANPFEARVVSRAVEGLGLRPVVVEQSEQALALLAQERPRVAVLAEGLNRTDERLLLESLRERAPGLPVLIVRDWRKPKSPLAGDEVLGRPINPTQLRQKLELLGARATGEVEAEPASESPPPLEEAGTQRTRDEPDEELELSWEETTPPPMKLPAGIDGQPMQQTADPRPRSDAQPPRLAPDPSNTPVEEGASPAALASDMRSHELPVPATSEFEAAEAAAFAAAAASAGPLESAEPAARSPTAAGGSEEPISPDDLALFTQAGSREPLLRMDDALAGDLLATQAPTEPDPRRMVARTARGAGLVDAASLPGIDVELGLSAHTLAVEASAEIEVVRPSRPLPGMDRAAPEPEPVMGLGDLPDSGDLATEELAHLLVRLHRSGFTGRLLLRRGEGEKTIFFDGGFPVHATSNLPHDRIGELLWREGKITREQHSRSRVMAERSGRRILDVLVDINALRRDELFAVQRHHGEEIVYSCFGWDRGSWMLGREAAARDERVSMAHPGALVLEGVRRKYGLERLVNAVGPPDRPFAATAALPSVIADAELSGSELEAVQSLRRGPRTVTELQAAGRLDQIGAYALVHGLLVLGGVARSTDLPAQEGGTDDPTMDRERVLAKHAQVLEGDYFAVLGVARAATTFEIRRAWERMRHDFAPERFDARVQAELAEALSEIREVIDEAWRALSDELLRESYREGLPLSS